MNIKCHKHKLDLFMICQNQFCNECRLVCPDCITQQIHTHQTDLKKEYIQCIREKFKQTQIDSRKFTIKLRDSIKQINEILREFEKQIYDNFIMSIDEIFKMECTELSDLINHMDKFVSISHDKLKVLENFVGDISQKFLDCQKELELDKLIYKKKTQQYSLGMDYYEQQNWRQAIISFDLSQTQNPQNINSLCQKGFCLANLNQFEQSNEIFEDILKRNSQHSQSIFGQGYCLQQQQQYEQSIIYFDKALSIDNKNIDVLLLKGESLRILKKYQEAIQIFERIIELDPNNVEAMTAKGKSLRLLNEYEESITWYDKSLQINPNHFQTLLLKGQSLKLLGRIEESEYFVNLAMTISK